MRAAAWGWDCCTSWERSGGHAAHGPMRGRVCGCGRVCGRVRTPAAMLVLGRCCVGASVHWRLIASLRGTRAQGLSSRGMRRARAPVPPARACPAACVWPQAARALVLCWGGGHARPRAQPLAPGLYVGILPPFKSALLLLGGGEVVARHPAAFAVLGSHFATPRVSSTTRTQHCATARQAYGARPRAAGRPRRRCCRGACTAPLPARACLRTGCCQRAQRCPRIAPSCLVD